MMRDFNFRVRKSLTVPVLVNGKYPVMDETANPILIKFKYENKNLKFKILPRMHRKFPVQENHQSSNLFQNTIPLKGKEDFKYRSDVKSIFLLKVSGIFIAAVM
jgi:hypothetical protein